jgi:iron complex transport system permease protein
MPAFMIQSLSFIFGLAAVSVSCLLSWLALGRGSKTLILILSGMVVSALFNALISIVKYTADPYSQLPEITFWLMGGLSDVTAGKLLATVIRSQ